MKNTIFKLTEYVYYFLLIVLLILYLFPGSLIGYFLYGNLGQQPNFIVNPIGTSINHLIFFTCLSFIGSIIRLKIKSFFNSFTFLLSISIILELLHLIIPNRAFEFFDLFANSAGVVIVFLLFILIKKLGKINKLDHKKLF